MAININIPIEDAVVDGSLNPVTSNAVFDALAALPSTSGFVPYTGATNDLDMGTHNVTADHISLNVSPSGTGFNVGSTQWNNTIGSSETLLKGGNVTIKNGVDLVARIVNKVVPNTTLTKANYQAVRVSGAQGGRLAVNLAQANNDNNSADTIGIVTETIATNQEGFILTVGQLENVNTTGSLQGETWVDGDVLYLSPTTAGRLTNIKPTAPGHIVVIGYVEYAHANNGKIYVKIMNGWELDELHNVAITSVTNGQVLQYDSATSLWKNATPSGGAITVGTTAVTSGTVGRVFFQGTGDVVQQDGNFTFDSTLKRLTLKAVGTAATDIVQRWRNSADTSDLGYIAGNGLAIIGVNASSSPTLIIDPSGSARATLRGGTNQSILLNSSGFNNLNGGSGGWDIEATGGQIRQRNGSNYTLLSGNFFGIGRTPSARLDVQAQGALSTDIAFRVRNSADNDNIIQVNGDMSLNLLGTATGGYINVARTTGGNVRMRHRATAVLPSIFQIHSLGDGGSVGQIQFDTFDGLTPGFTMQRLISGLSDLTGATLYSGFGTNAATFVMKNALNYGGYGVVPTGTAADHFAMYSADIVAGNAAPHFRTENGNIIKLYQQSSAGITTVAQLVTVMQNLGLLS